MGINYKGVQSIKKTRSE